MLQQSRARELGLAGASAALLCLSFPTFDIGPLAWVGLVPLLLALEGKGVQEAFLLAYVTGLVFTTGVFSWIWSLDHFTLLDYLLLGVLYLPLYVGLWGLGLAWMRRRTGLPAVLIAPPLWVTLEYLRSHAAFLSLPWALLGHSQYQYPSLIQIASCTGVYGLTFLIVLMNAAIAEAIGVFYRRCCGTAAVTAVPRALLVSPIVAGALLLVTVIYGRVVLAEGSAGERVVAALIQGNIPQTRKWDAVSRQTILERYAALTRQAAQRTPALIVWPETAVPGDVQHEPDLQRAVSEVARAAQAYLLVGSATYAKFAHRQLKGKYYNSLVLFSPGGEIVGEYRKLALVPFGEYVPLQGVVRWPKAIVPSIGSLLPGDQYTLFTVPTATFGAVICWETIFPELFRTFVQQGAQFMINATNEAWFGETAAAYQLLAMSTFRAVENRVAVARATNTGVSALIDPFGRITARLQGPDRKELFVEGVLVGDIPLSHGTTFYTRHGDVCAFLLITVSAFLLGYAVLPLGIRRKLAVVEQS